MTICKNSTCIKQYACYDNIDETGVYCKLHKLDGIKTQMIAHFVLLMDQRIR